MSQQGRPRVVEEGVALDPRAVLTRFGAELATWAGFRPTACTTRLLRRTSRRLVLHYRLSRGSRLADVVGKWYASRRGALVYDLLIHLRANGFDSAELGVPRPIAYAHDLRVIFMEFVPGPLLRERLPTEQPLAERAGVWLAALHRVPATSPRDVGPGKQQRDAQRWIGALGRGPTSETLMAALEDLQNPGRLVHYDYHHSQLLLPPGGGSVVIDLDESGLGDPAWDIAHFEAHLELLGLQWYGDPQALAGARRAFRDGYRRVARLPNHQPALAAYAWLKLAHQLVARGRPEYERAYARQAVARALSTARLVVVGTCSPSTRRLRGPEGAPKLSRLRSRA